MSLTRLIILGLLFYILYRIIFGQRQEPPVSGPPPPPARDVLVEDPVCHTYVPEGQAVTLRHQGTTLHFCSEKCRDQFIKDS